MFTDPAWIRLHDKRTGYLLRGSPRAVFAGRRVS
jgi:hypothetical protein